MPTSRPKIDLVPGSEKSGVIKEQADFITKSTLPEPVKNEMLHRLAKKGLQLEKERELELLEELTKIELNEK